VVEDIVLIRPQPCARTHQSGNVSCEASLALIVVMLEVRECVHTLTRASVVVCSAHVRHTQQQTASCQELTLLMPAWLPGTVNAAAGSSAGAAVSCWLLEMAVRAYSGQKKGC